MKLRTLIASFATLAGVITAQAAEYYWIGGDAGDWANGNNWSLTVGGEAAGAYPNSSSDTATLATASTVTLKSSTYVRTITVDADVKFQGGKIQTNGSNNTAPLTVNGSGKLTLSGVELIAPYATSAAASQSTISCALEIAEGTVNTLSLATGNTRYSSWTVSGKLTGSGSLIVSGGNNTENYIASFSCDASDFSGSFADWREGDSYHARVRFTTATALSAKATYTLETQNTAGSNYPLRAGGSSVTYQMGALNGTVYFDGNNNTKSGQYFGYTLEIGGKNEDCSFAGTLARGGYKSYTKKVGTADMTFSGSQIPDLEIVDGTYIIGSSTAVPTQMRFTGGAFSVAEGVTVEPAQGFAADSTTAVVYDDRGINATWVSTLSDSRVPMGFTKKGSGTLTLTTIPRHTTLTTIAAGTLVVPQGTVIAELAVIDGAKLTVPLTGDESETVVLTVSKLAAGTTLEMLQAAVASSVSTVVAEEDESGYVIKASRSAQTFTWTGAVDAMWQEPGNWSVNGVAATEIPQSMDTVVFPAEGAPWSVVNTLNTTVARVIAEGDLELEIDNGNPIRTPMVCGEGVITFKTSGFFAPVNAAQQTCVISNNLVFTEGYVGTIRLSDAQELRVRLHGDVSGQGALTVAEGSQRNGGVLVYGDWQQFSGSFAVTSSNQYRRDYTKFFGVKSVSPNVDYTIYGNDSDDLLEVIEGDSKGAWRMGSISGRLYMTSASAGGHTLTVGRSADFACGGNVGHKSQNGTWYQFFIRKVGSGMFTSMITNVYGLYVKEGTVKLGSAEALPIDALTFEGGVLKAAEGVDPSMLVKNSAAPIAFDDEGMAATWATALASSNVGGLVKKGAGTLTLADIPAYAGVTTVEASELVVPAATRIHWDILSAGTLTGSQPTSYDYQVGTTNVYDSAAAVPSAGNHTLNLDNLLAIDLTSVTTVESDSKFVIAVAKTFNFGGKRITKSQREKIELIWGKDTVFPRGKTAADYTLQVVNGQLVVANKPVGIAIIIK